LPRTVEEPAEATFAGGEGVAWKVGPSITGWSSTNVASVLADELWFAFVVVVGTLIGLSSFDRTSARNASSLSGVTADNGVLIISRNKPCNWEATLVV
jgi:hypothetical protein